MKSRCTNSNSINYSKYGGRGIKVCDRWINSFENFINDMGRKPSPEYSMERKDNDKGYSPENCIRDTKLNQNINRNIKTKNKLIGVEYKPPELFKDNKDRWTVRFSINGKSKTLCQTKDFFEACCARKSAENKYWYNLN